MPGRMSRSNGQLKTAGSATTIPRLALADRFSADDLETSDEPGAQGQRHDGAR